MSRDAAVLVVDDDAGMRRLVRTALELEGQQVVEAASLAQAQALLGHELAGVVLDRHLPDGDGLTLLPLLRDAHPQLTLVVHTSDTVPEGVPSAPKGDVDEILRLLALPAAAPARAPFPAAVLTRSAAAELRDEWFELCQWDPELPPGSRPAIAEPVIDAISDALERPQPLGWGLDPALETVAEAHSLNAAGVDVAIGQLICLREAFERRVVSRLPAPEQPDSSRRLNMIVMRMVSVTARYALEQLQQQAFSDPLTGLGNRRAFEVDFERERSRAVRHGRPLGVAVLDVEGLKRVNDEQGHAEGDQRLRSLASALRGALRREDAAYRIGGDEFVVLAPDTVLTGPEFMRERIRAAGAPPCTVGVASHPGDDLSRLVEIADQRLYDQRRRGTRPTRGLTTTS